MPKFWSRKRRDADPLPVRQGSAAKRDVYKAATAGVTGITAFGALAVTGAAAGAAAHQGALDQARKAVVPPAGPVPARVVVRHRKHRTVVRTQIVHAVSTAGVARASTGGTVSYGSTSTVTASSGGSTTTHYTPRPAPAPAPAPKPKPAPSSGS